MLAEIVHINGLYDIASNTHTNPMPHERLTQVVRTCEALANAPDSGHTFVYRPNHGPRVREVALDSAKLNRALESDPLLSIAPSELRDRITVFPDGHFVPTETVAARKTVELEALRRYRAAVVFGIYTLACVIDVAEYLKRLHPAATVRIDTDLSMGGLALTGRAGWSPAELDIGRESLEGYLQHLTEQ
jgi:hypothetical protein